MYEEKKRSKVATFLIILFVTLLIIIAVAGYIFLKKSFVENDEAVVGNEESNLEVLEFNNAFSKYLGKDLTYADLNNLLEEVIASNYMNEDDVIGVIVTNGVGVDEAIGDLEKCATRLIADETYKIEFIYNDNKKITKINVFGEISQIDPIQEAFNERILKYQDSGISGTELNELVDILIELNLDDENENKVSVKIISTTGEELVILSDELVDRTKIGSASAEKLYEITTTKDTSTGYIYVVVIEDLGTKVDIFNRSFNEVDNTEVSGAILNNLLDLIIANNNESEEYIDIKITTAAGVVTEYLGENAMSILTIGRATDGSTYKIIIGLDSQTGLVNRLEATEVKQNVQVDLSENSFNAKYKAYEGENVLRKCCK